MIRKSIIIDPLPIIMHIAKTSLHDVWFNFMCEFKIYLVTSCCDFNKHRVISAIKTLLIF